MRECDRGEIIDPEELGKLRRRSRQYLEIMRKVVRAQRSIADTACNWGGDQAAYEAMGVLHEIYRVVHKEEGKKSQELVPAEEREGLTSTKVVDLVYGELAASGRVIKKFGVRFPLVDDSDWHRTDICYFGGNGVAIEVAGGRRIALVVGRPVERRRKTSFEKGLIYTVLNDGDPVTGKKGLDFILRRVLLEENKGLHVVEGGLFLYGEEVSRKYAVGVRESEENFRGQGRLGHIVFTGEKGEEVPPNLRPEIIISGYKGEVVPYLVKRIKEELGIKELPKLMPTSGKFTEGGSVIK